MYNLLLVDLIFLAVFLKYYSFVLKHGDYFRANILQVAYTNVLFVVIIPCLFMMTNVMLLMVTIGLVEMLIWRIKLWQLDYTISCYNLKRRKNLTIRQICTVFRKILHYISSINPYFGKVFVSFLGISVPVTCVLLKLTLFDQMKTLFVLVFLLLIVHQFACIFGVHFFFARRNFQLRELNKRILKIPFNRRLHRRTGIKLALFVQATYTRRKYGLTYWKFGRISMLSFAKVRKLNSDRKLVCNLFFCSQFVLLYTEAIMYIYLFSLKH